MRSYIQDACEDIDAAVFSGSAFLEKEERDALRKYIARWEQQMKECEDIEPDSTMRRWGV